MLVQQVKLTDFARAPRVYLLHVDGAAKWMRVLGCLFLFLFLIVRVPERVRGHRARSHGTHSLGEVNADTHTHVFCTVWYPHLPTIRI